MACPNCKCDREQTLIDVACAAWPTVPRAQVASAVRRLIALFGIDHVWHHWSFDLFREAAYLVAAR